MGKTYEQLVLKEKTVKEKWNLLDKTGITKSKQKGKHKESRTSSF